MPSLGVFTNLSVNCSPYGDHCGVPTQGSLSFEVEFGTDSKSASKNFVGASVTIYIATSENSVAT